MVYSSYERTSGPDFALCGRGATAAGQQAAMAVDSVRGQPATPLGPAAALHHYCFSVLSLEWEEAGSIGRKLGFGMAFEGIMFKCNNEDKIDL